jgi:prepilin peptidase CpaA
MTYLIYASLFGGALTLFIVQFRMWPLPYTLGSQPWVQKLHDKDSGVPYGIALAAAALMIYPDTLWMKGVDLARLAGG